MGRVLKNGYLAAARRPEKYRNDIYAMTFDKEDGISVLLLPGTGALFASKESPNKDDYSSANVARIAQAALLRWGTGQAKTQWTNADKKKAWDKFRSCAAYLRTVPASPD